MKFYEIEIAGLKRQLPICPVNDEIEIAAFVMFSDVEITEKSASELLKLVPDFDIILTAEAKSIPLAYEMSKLSNKNYIVARKSKKVYITDPLMVEVTSITTKGSQCLYVSCEYVEMMKDKKVLIVDDVISVGNSLKALEEIVIKSGGIIASRACVLTEGDSNDREDIISLGKLPIFKK